VQRRDVARRRPTRFAGILAANLETRGGPMLMFKRTQLYIGFALAALAEILVRITVR
jgi:hypothetical protein